MSEGAQKAVEAGKDFESGTSDLDAKHLVVLQHGFWGLPAEFSHLSKLLKRTYNGALVVVNCSLNAGFATNSGVHYCGDRVVDALTKKYLKQGNVTKISFIGHSMGGLINRFVIGRLEELRVFDTITPVNYITLATPHTGAFREGTGCYARYINKCGHFSGKAGEQFCLLDNYHQGVALVHLMGTPGTPFFEGLRRFQRRVCYANVYNDGLVDFLSASVRESDPYPNKICAVVADKYPSIVEPCAPETSKHKLKLTAATTRVLISNFLGYFLDTLITFLLLLAGSYVRLAGKKGTAETPESSSWLEGKLEAHLLAQDKLPPIELSTLLASNLNQMSWERVDVYTKGFREHAVIHTQWIVKTNDVLQHLVDNFQA